MDFNPCIAIVSLDDFVGNQLLVLFDHRVIKAATDQALDGEERIFRICDCLAFGRLANKRSPSSVKATMEGVVRAPSAFSITFGLPAIHDCNARIGGAKVNTDYLSHNALH